MQTFGKTLCFKSLLLFLFVFFNQCTKERLNRNPYLSDLTFRYEINLNLPQYDNLRYAGGSLLIPQIGLKGVLVFNLNGTQFLAWEATCPNHTPKSCSALSITGVLANCSCEDYQYSLATGQLLNPDSQTNTSYPMLNYQVQKSSNLLLISN
jgi:nitrite reductase/ring-hydroxylating ferredoxin subunit